MTEEQFYNKLTEIATKARISTVETGLRLFRSDGIDPADYEDNYILPKIILIAALREEADSWILPNDPKHKRAINNLKHF